MRCRSGVGPVLPARPERCRAHHASTCVRSWKRRRRAGEPLHTLRHLGRARLWCRARRRRGAAHRTHARAECAAAIGGSRSHPDKLHTAMGPSLGGNDTRPGGRTGGSLDHAHGRGHSGNRCGAGRWSPVVSTSLDGAATSHKVEGLVPGGVYAVRLAARNPAGQRPGPARSIDPARTRPNAARANAARTHAARPGRTHRFGDAASPDR